ncbi:MAG: hypothetical protein H0T78_07280, partial [Longispora sp.]|nr:hypothetical protein [Longispora sp. (in: high G+C Gram-positive bacteria)]
MKNPPDDLTVREALLAVVTGGEALPAEAMDVLRGEMAGLQIYELPADVWGHIFADMSEATLGKVATLSVGLNRLVAEYRARRPSDALEPDADGFVHVHSRSQLTGALRSGLDEDDAALAVHMHLEDADLAAIEQAFAHYDILQVKLYDGATLPVAPGGITVHVNYKGKLGEVTDGGAVHVNDGGRVTTVGGGGVEVHAKGEVGEVTGGTVTVHANGGVGEVAGGKVTV